MSKSLLLVVVLGVVIAGLLQPRIGIRDSDAVGYVLGAYSIQTGNGYRDLSGAALNHWPPGFSFLLSLFNDPIRAATVINYASWSIAGASLFLIATKLGWPKTTAAACSLGLSAGFFRSFATNAKPDILCYAAFLLALLAYFGSRGSLRFLAYLLWSILILFKLIAVVFIPAALISAFWDRPSNTKYCRELFVGGLFWAAAVGFICVFNRQTVGAFLPASYQVASAHTVLDSVQLFLFSIPRSFLVYWYGSILGFPVLLAFGLCLTSALVCLVSLRFDSANLVQLLFGAACLVLTFIMECLGHFDAAVRLTGYGLLIVLFSLRPKERFSAGWITYGVLVTILAVLNGMCVNSLGANDFRYAEVVKRMDPSLHTRQTIYTNSFHLTDLHCRVPSYPVKSPSDVPLSDLFLYVDLPQYDAIATTVWPTAKPSSDWLKIAETEGATLYQRVK